jgi:hypothetical protein
VPLSNAMPGARLPSGSAGCSSKFGGVNSRVCNPGRPDEGERRELAIGMTPTMKRLKGLRCGELAQDEGQNAAIVEICELIERRNAANERHFLDPAIGESDFRLHHLTWL